MTYTDFDADGLADEFAFAVALFITLMATVEIVKSLTSTEDAPQRRTEQSVALNEDVLRRLENGETVVVQRWHGHDLELSGTQVIDVETVEENSEDA